MTLERKLELEIVSHCWNYSRMLTYQLSSLVLSPPKDVNVTMTVFYSKEDERTCEVLNFFGEKTIENVKWNWRDLDKPHLWRRAIGRNMAALETKADWVFYTDCDQVFGEGCLDSFNQLASLPKDKTLVYPKYAYCTEHIGANDQIFQAADQGPTVLDIDVSQFHQVLHPRAIGGVQIARADVLRKIGYCRDVPKFMKPEPRWKRTKEDVVFRKLMGTNGDPIDIPNLYRMEHKQKGRRWYSWRFRL